MFSPKKGKDFATVISIIFPSLDFQQRILKARLIHLRVGLERCVERTMNAINCTEK
jgi:hypothetical protein